MDETLKIAIPQPGKGVDQSSKKEEVKKDQEQMTAKEFLTLIQGNNAVFDDKWLLKEALRIGSVDCMVAFYRHRLDAFLDEVKNSEEPRWDDVGDLRKVCTLALAIADDALFEEKWEKLLSLLVSDRSKRNPNDIRVKIERDVGEMIDKMALASKLD